MNLLLCSLIYAITAVSGLQARLPGPFWGTFDRWEKGKKIKILLAGYNGARNTGSDVRVAEIARLAGEEFGRDRAEITVMTLDVPSLEGYFDPDVTLLPFSSLFPLDLWKACASHHALILCEGSTLKSTFANALTLFLCEAAGIMGAQGKPCIAFGAEVGKMEPFIEKAAGRLCRDTWFITRTEGSFSSLKRLGLHGHTGTDAAWSWNRDISDEETCRLLTDRGWDGKKPLLGIAVIDPFCWPVRASLFRWIRGILKKDLSGQYDRWYFFSDSEDRRASYDRYIRAVAGAVRTFLTRHDFFPVLLGMEALDRKACLDLASLLDAPSALFLSRENSAQVMTGVLRRLSLLVTSRYHAAVLSMEGGCPIAAVSMDERLDGIMKEVSLEPYLLHTDDTDLEERLARSMDLALGSSEEIRGRIRDRLPLFKKTLSERGTFMKTYITEGLEKAPSRRGRLSGPSR